MAYHSHREGEHLNRLKHDLCLSKAITSFSESEYSHMAGDKQVLYSKWKCICVHFCSLVCQSFIQVGFIVLLSAQLFPQPFIRVTLQATKIHSFREGATSPLTLSFLQLDWTHESTSGKWLPKKHINIKIICLKRLKMNLRGLNEGCCHSAEHFS